LCKNNPVRTLFRNHRTQGSRSGKPFPKFASAVPGRVK